MASAPRMSPPPSLARRYHELQAIALLGAVAEFKSGRELHYRFQISPSDFGRQYTCRLQMSPDSRMPSVFVLRPDLCLLAADRPLPHVYPHGGVGTKLCLWWPKRREWNPQMALAETYLAWTAEWLWYFEDWLINGEWSGGGEHPTPRAKRHRMRATSTPASQSHAAIAI